MSQTSTSVVELLQVGGENIVRKTYCDPNFGGKLYQREVRAYQILGVNGTPHTLRLLRHCAESQWTLELEHLPNVGRYYPETMDELKQYARRVLKVPLHPCSVRTLSQQQWQCLSIPCVLNMLGAAVHSRDAAGAC
jgi:hypothetical protein